MVHSLIIRVIFFQVVLELHSFFLSFETDYNINEVLYDILIQVFNVSTPPVFQTFTESL